MELTQLGWNRFFSEPFQAFEQRGLLPARVFIEFRGSYRVLVPAGELAAEVSGRFRHEAVGAGDFPAVGDWVAVEPFPSENKALIHAVLPRRSKVSRTAPGKTAEEQVVAANVDDLLIVAALSAPLNLRRIERYLALAWESGAEPAVVLTKTDLCEDVAEAIRRVEQVTRGVRIFPVSCVSRAGMDHFGGSLQPERTVALLGPSGVGKSTLINFLCGEEILPTLPVREWDQKGRHTTTNRELIRLPSGALVIDTPGLRELQLWDGAEGINEAFGEIEELARQCRFGDCRHETEPGCAVLAAIELGTLTADRLGSYRKLRNEQAYFERRHDKRAQAEERRRLRAIHKRVKAIYRHGK